jgi:signal transduction histidine kinase
MFDEELMPPIAQTQLQDNLLAHSPHIARDWLRALNTTTPLANHPVDLMDHLVDITRQITLLLFEEPLDRQIARSLGVRLAGLWSHDPLVLGRSQEVVGNQLVDHFPSDQVSTLFPRLNSILADFAVGFMAADGDKPLPRTETSEQTNGADPSAEQALDDRERKLTQLKQRFSTLVTHEFRTPMATILAASDLLRHYEHQLSHSRKQELFDSIQHEIRDLDRLLGDILLVSTAQSYGLQFTPSLLNPENFSRLVITQTLSRIQIPDNRVTFTITSSSNIQSEIRLDEDLFRNMLSRLLLNAILYSPPESKVEIALDYDDEGLVLQVRDHGLGISQKDQQHIFDTFYRGENIGFMPGLGLGLALVKQCVTAHQGTITFESSEGIGTTFVVRLPLRPS